uniref:Membrane spanning protein n=1 Tax=Parastrongyloides trichosuri TaxID=131310 RepID=A0A0N4ZWV5_PARTI
MIRELCYIAISFAPILPFLFSGIFHSSLQIIIAFFGAFAWILAILVSSIFWKVGSLIYENIYFYAALTIIIQEGFRAGFYYVIRYGEKTLAKLESRTNIQVSGYSPMDKDINDVSAAAGFGMGIISQALLTVNNFVHDAHHGTPGILNFVSIIQKYDTDAYIPKSMISNGLSILLPCTNLMFNLGWTMITWRSLHKLDNKPFTFINLLKCYGLYASILTHFLVTAFSSLISSV